MELERFTTNEFNNEHDLLRKLDNCLEQFPTDLLYTDQIMNKAIGQVKENIFGEIHIIYSDAKSLVGKKYHFNYKPLLIGRKLTISDIDLTPDNEIIRNVMSRLHALIYLKDNLFFIRDIILNGTL